MVVVRVTVWACRGRDSAKGLSGAMWYEDHSSPARWTLELMERFEQCHLQYSALDSGPSLGR